MLSAAFKALKSDVDTINKYVVAKNDAANAMHSKATALCAVAAKLAASEKKATASNAPSATAMKSAAPTAQAQAKAAATATTSKNAGSTKPKKKADQNPSTLIQEEHEQKIPTPLATIENWWLCKDGSIKGIIVILTFKALVHLTHQPLLARQSVVNLFQQVPDQHICLSTRRSSLASII